MKTLHKKFVFGLLLFANFGSAVYAQNKNITYRADTVTNFANPERGWYHSYVADCCDKLGATSDAEPLELKAPHAPIVLSDLQAIRNTPERMTLYRDIVK